MGRQATIVRGLLAGAAGTAVLDAVTYLDMATRGRPASTTPERSVERLAKAGHIPLGAGESAGNRRTGLGALLGYATGAGVAAGYCALVGRRLPWPAAAALLTAAAMAGSNAPLTLLRVTDPRHWSAADWVADVVPHLAYGAVTAATLDRLR
ncbi:hypothetical protein RB614_06210 [Phytohabitans sp. ZYX-F-186]|uniref:DUF1440 domain-containing protein n=1 Tax=Phytohabitans maris TaxID=3071409 RepID=A0ABU0ZCL7_9ACTN|nr:hypothetical protein [Phytohabitans sp. ZYX-F-186]MDQ7904116.1 hypothetical protein [Phytohabitans sp. ZYX-F-186]